MFVRVAPQKVRHSGGYVVQVANRSSVEYLDAKHKAVIAVEFGRSVGVYASTLKERDDSGLELRSSPVVRAEILGRIVAGLEAMGSTVELC